ncbi:phospholipid-transporting ATPase ABCA3-like [Euwallacea similis]|uniref:phospholipid-transporting ATPase ABCA3-like n=1 Tax=Euwallacea similis TaxID=1736056 RepID=UPI00344F425E
MNSLRAVLWKNLYIRKHHWVLGIFEIALPVFLFVLIAYARSEITEFSKREITNATYHEKYLVDYSYHGINLEDTMFYYTPADQYFSDIAHRLQEKLQIINNNLMKFKNEKILLQEYSKTNATTVIAIIFNSKPRSSKLDYTIRYYKEYFNWRTNKLYEDEFTFEPGKGSDYSWEGFLTLQKAIDMSFIEKEAEAVGRSVPEVFLEVEEFPYPPYKSDIGSSALFVYYLPLITLFSFLFICPAVLQRVVEEKYTGIKELMRMMGMKSWVRWFGWFIYSIIPMTISVFLIVTLLKVDFFNAGYPPIEFSDYTILAAFLILYCIAITIKCFLLSTLFHKPAVATLVGLLVWIFSYFIPKHIIDMTYNIPFSMHFCIMLLPNMALHYGYLAISQYEIRELGVQWSNWHLSGGGSSQEITLFHTCIMLIVDSIIYFLLTLYLDAIMPGKYGIPQSKLFPLKFIKSCFTTSRNIAEDIELGEAFVECKHAIKLLNVSKKYETRTVINNLDMDVHKNQINVLLGHNGAGKSTIMNIITGMTNKTEGRIYINNKEILNSSDITQSIGLCPQHNLFFGDLTIWQHMMFISMVKELTFTDAESEIRPLLEILNLYNKRHEYPHTLSGGMQRKLCLAMAAIGGPEILILDEPSSGMDPQSRREMWNLLLQWRKHKTILITTHFMEEADALADQTIIINEGSKKCSGTPMELKWKYGCGATLTLLIKETERVEETANTIKKKWSGMLELKKIDGNEIQFTIEKGNNAELFKKLEECKEQLKIVNISYRNTNLEDVFINTLSRAGQDDIIAKIDDPTIRLMQKNKNLNFRHKLIALLLKRYYFICSQILFYVFPIVMMLLMVGICIILGNNFDYFNKGGPIMNLSLKTYGNSTLFEHSNRTEANLKIQKYYADLVENVGSVFVEHEDVLSAIIDEGLLNLPYYRRHLIAATEFLNIELFQPIKAVALYNNLAIHSAPISVNLITNTIAKYILGQNYSIAVHTHPLANTHAHTTDELSEIQIGLLWLVIMPTGFLLFLGSFIYFPFTELSTKFERIQYICGVYPIYYWGLMFLFDLFVFLIIALLTVILILVWSPFRGIEEIVVLYLILVCYGICGIPFSYLFSRKNAFSSAYALFVIINLMSGILISVIVFALEESGYNNFKITMKMIFMVISPQFGLTYCGVTFSRNVIQNYNFQVMDDGKRLIVCNSNSPPTYCNGDLKRNYLDTLGPFMLLTILGGLLFLLLNIVFDNYHNIISKCRKRLGSCKRHSDKEISKGENEKLNKKECGSLRVKKLTKCYNGKKVVNKIDLTLNEGECVGILGENGAGKSTTFRMLTKEEERSNGEIQINDISIDENQYIEKLGYCPQNDALNMFLTGRQILKTIARLRGISNDEIVEYFIDITGLKDIANMPCNQYSGGNKRKLNLAMAIMGFPKFNLLDEPTNGVDPLSRRSLWTLIRNIKKTYRTSIILTSHSMDECEALCNNIRIMKEGKIIKSGTISDLKKKEVGFNVKIKLKDCNKEQVEALKERITEEIGIFDIIDEHSNLLHLHIKNEQKWAPVFEKFDKFKSERDSLVEYYEINEASLEKIFLATVKNEYEKNF